MGIAFALGFTIGPPIGAYLASVNVLDWFPMFKRFNVNSYSSPALFALLLIIIETIYLYLALPETKKQSQARRKSSHTRISLSVEKQLSFLSSTHFLYLFFFSGMEFTLSFLTFEVGNV